MDMTAQEAFSIVFDEWDNEAGPVEKDIDSAKNALAVALDAMPGNDMPRNTLPNKPNAPSGLKKNAAAAPGAKTTSSISGGTSDTSLAEHMARYHPNGFDPQTDSCNLFDSIVGNIEQQGVNHEEAVRRAMLMHNAGTIKPNQGQQYEDNEAANKGEPLQTPQEQSQAPINGQAQAEKIEAMEEDPSLTLTNKSEPLVTGPDQVTTPLGDVEVKTDTAKASATVLADAMAEGGEKGLQAEKALRQVMEMQAQSPNQQESPQGEQPPMGNEPSGEEPSQPQTKTFESKLHPDVAIEIDDETASILEQDPQKAELLDRIIDARIKKAGTSSEAERRDLDNDIGTLNRMFYGEERESQESQNQQTSTPARKPTPTNQESETPKEDMSTPNESTAPKDSEFETSKSGVYQVGDTEYKDVSHMGLLHGMIASFMAGLHGQEIITGWDRISGKWDEIKRSANGESVRSGIAASLFGNELNKYAAMDNLSDSAKAELSIIQDMADQAKTPSQQLSAFKQFKKWKTDYKEELGEMHREGDAPVKFPSLPNDYKGTTPPLSILKQPEGYTADKEFGEKVAGALQDRMAILGTPVNEVESIKVGPSATTIEFKVSPLFNINKAKSNATRESLKGAIGAPVNDIEYAKGKVDVVSVTVSNPEMRNVSFADSMHSKEWKEFSSKAALPVPLGKDASGHSVNLDLARQPHMMVTGASGSGKSIFFAAAINGLEMAKTPDKARIVILDPKDEFRAQDGSPHLLYPRAKEPKDIANVISNLRSLMQERITKIGGTIKEFDPAKNEYQGDSEHTITEYNAAHPEETPMAHIMIVFDEFANISKDPAYGPQVMADVSQILALGRSVGINMMIGTQRNDVKSIPGEIQANAPCHLAFKASKDDAKASQEVKDLAGSGDFLLSDSGGRKVRGRGCFITKEETSAVPAYYRNHMSGEASPEENGKTEEKPTSLPKEYADGIAQAIKNNQSISVQAIEGLEEAFKKVIPKGWTIEEEEVDGDKHWKAYPPRTSRVDVENVKKEKAKAPDRVDFSSRANAVASIKAIENAAIGKAEKEYAKDGDFFKLKQARQKARAATAEYMEYTDEKFPEVQDVDELAKSESPLGMSEEQAAANTATEEQVQQNVERIKEKREEIDGKIEALKKQRKSGKITPLQYEDAKDELEKEYGDYSNAVKEGKTDREFYTAIEKAKKDKEAAETAELERKRSLVQTKSKGKPIVGATHILDSARGKAENIVPVPKRLLDRIKLPEGFEIDTDDKGRPLSMMGKWGYARKKDGSWGVFTADGKFKIRVNTSSPDILGPEHPKTKEAKAKLDQLTKSNASEAEIAQAEKDYNLKSRGVEDSWNFSENVELVAMAVANALFGPPPLAAEAEG